MSRSSRSFIALAIALSCGTSVFVAPAYAGGLIEQRAQVRRTVSALNKSRLDSHERIADVKSRLEATNRKSLVGKVKNWLVLGKNARLRASLKQDLVAAKN